MPEVREVDPDLVLASGLRRGLAQRVRREPAADSKPRHRRQAGDTGRRRSHHDVRRRVEQRERHIDAALVGWVAFDQREVSLVDVAAGERLGQLAGGGAVARHQQRARGLTVDPMRDLHLYARVALAQQRRQGVAPELRSRVHGQSGRLVDAQHTFVLVEDLEVARHRRLDRWWAAQLNGLAGTHGRRRSSTAAVREEDLLVDDRLDARAREPPDSALEKVVEAPAPALGGHDDVADDHSLRCSTGRLSSAALACFTSSARRAPSSSRNVVVVWMSSRPPASTASKSNPPVVQPNTSYTAFAPAILPSSTVAWMMRPLRSSNLARCSRFSINSTPVLRSISRIVRTLEIATCSISPRSADSGLNPDDGFVGSTDRCGFGGNSGRGVGASSAGTAGTERAASGTGGGVGRPTGRDDGGTRSAGRGVWVV